MDFDIEQTLAEARRLDRLEREQRLRTKAFWAEYDRRLALRVARRAWVAEQVATNPPSLLWWPEQPARKYRAHARLARRRRLRAADGL